MNLELKKKRLDEKIEKLKQEREALDKPQFKVGDRVMVNAIEPFRATVIETDKDSIKIEYSCGKIWVSEYVIEPYTPWKPKDGEVYFVPDPFDPKKAYETYNTGGSIDQHCIENGLAFKTKEEAITMANKMIELAKNS